LTFQERIFTRNPDDSRRLLVLQLPPVRRHPPVPGVLLLFALACSSGSGGGGDGSSSAGVAPRGASAAALESAVDGADPWAVLGELSGDYSAEVGALASDCTYGPEVPFDGRWPWQPFLPFSGRYQGTLEQRGDEVVFEIGEGLVFARVEGDRLVDVVRVGAEGVTRYEDGFAIRRVGSGAVLSGESDWSYEPGYYDEEPCGGRASWHIALKGDAPSGSARDLHFVLRWPAASHADLDLLVEQTERRGDGDHRAFLGEVQNRCHVLHSAGTAGAAGDSQPVAWIQPLAETELPHHEEIVRCQAAPYGSWYLDVANWSADERVDFEIEVFEGPTIGVDRDVERALGMLEERVAPHDVSILVFQYVPPPSGGSAGGIITTRPITRRPLEREDDPLTGSGLGFNKAAALDVSYAEFLENLGL
jgi:hypothetical protein